MDKTPEEKEAIIRAALGGKMDLGIMIATIFVAVEECFMAKFEQVDNKIVIKFYNGQKFELVLNEV